MSLLPLPPFPGYRNHAQTSARESLVASKLLYEFSVATGKKVDDLSVYGRTMTLFKGAQV